MVRKELFTQVNFILAFFETVYQPVQIQFTLEEAKTTQLFDYLNSKNISIFNVKAPMQFGVVGNQKGE
ncbi:hypothetical protein OHW15_17975 [Acinetobacter baumannii]|nr:hypothetical protein [Acinetobacter baumannii]